MLKIKDNVDLKELEKFGFAYRKYYNNYIKLHSEKNYHDFVDNYIQIEKNGTIKPFVQLLDRHSEKYIDKNQALIKDEFLDTIYDLIQAGLVEKVEDDS